MSTAAIRPSYIRSGGDVYNDPPQRRRIEPLLILHINNSRVHLIIDNFCHVDIVAKS
jgi:hypothetical protein